MARVTQGGLISGRIDQLVFYSMNGKNYVRSRPQQTRKKKLLSPLQSRNTTAFSITSSSSSAMLTRLRPHLLFPCPLATYNAFRSWMYKQYMKHVHLGWEIADPLAGMFQFNPLTDLRDLINVDMQVADMGSGKLKIKFGTFSPVKQLNDVPAGTKTVAIRLFAFTSPFEKDRKGATLCSAVYRFDYNHDSLPAQEIELNTQSAQGHMAVVVAAVEFYRNTDHPYQEEQRFLPAAVIAMGRLLPPNNS